MGTSQKAAEHFQASNYIFKYPRIHGEPSATLSNSLLEVIH